MLISFILSAIYRSAVGGKRSAMFICFVRVRAALALRNSLCHELCALFHNKAQQLQPSAAGRAKARRCAYR